MFGFEEIPNSTARRLTIRARPFKLRLFNTWDERLISAYTKIKVSIALGNTETIISDTNNTQTIHYDNFLVDRTVLILLIGSK